MFTSPAFIFSDVDQSNHKITQKQLSIVVEGEASDTQSHNHLLAEHNGNLSEASSSENLAVNTRAKKHSSFNLSSNRLKPEALDDHSESGNSRRPSILLEMQDMISSRRPSAIMASLRRGSQSIMNNFRPKQDDPNDHVGARSPEAVESRRKNRRIGE